jgi:hypothetical protein
MKRVMVIALSVAIALALVGLVAAQTTPPTKPAPATAPATATPTQAPQVQKVQKPATAKPVATPPAAKPKMITGTVVSVDAVANTIVLKYNKVDKTFTVDPAAKIMVAGQPAKLADIQKDAKVSIIYKIDGKNKVAIAIK